MNNHRCAYCGCELAYNDMQVDHIESVYRTDYYSNFEKQINNVETEMNYSQFVDTMTSLGQGPDMPCTIHCTQNGNTLEEPEKPCKVGDTVYSISTTAEGPLTKIRILEMEVTNLIVSPENKYRIVAKDAENKNEYFYDASDIDKTLFLTREDAEAELEYYG